MKRISLVLFAFITLAVVFSSCGQTEFDATTEAEVSSGAASQDDTHEEEAFAEAHRKIVKTASISLNVDQLEKSILDLKAFLKPINGYVYNYEIANESYESDQFQKNMDSTVLVNKITPSGSLSVRVPIAAADSFINYVLNGNAQISSLKINDEDITENLWEKKQIAQVYDGSKKTAKNSSKNISYDNNTSIDAIKAKASAAQMDFKTKYLWFDIIMTAKPFYTSTTTIAAKNYRTPLHIAFANSLLTGWHMCADMILGLVTIWPVLLLIGLVLLFIRKYRVKYS